MSTLLANEDELYFERGGVVQGFTRKVFLRLGVTFSVRGRIIGFLLITWFPLLIFSMLEGRALGPTPRESFLLDFSTYLRFFLGVPLLLIAELVVGPRLRETGLQFLRGGFVRDEDLPAFEHAIDRVKRLRESVWAEMIILGTAMAGAWYFTSELLAQQSVATWRTPNASGSGIGLSLTAFWFRLISVPILQFLWYRWLWRMFIWARFLWSVSRMELDLVGTHPDAAGGLGFLGTAHMSLGIFCFGLSAVLSGEAAFLIVFEHVDIETLKFPFAVLIAFSEFIVFGPLLIFIPILTRTRLAWLREYSKLSDRYNRAFHEKWVQGNAATDEALLGSADIQSLADLGTSFEYIRGMRVYPFNLRVMIHLAVITSLPCLPLLLLVMPVGRILELLSKAIL